MSRTKKKKEEVVATQLVRPTKPTKFCKVRMTKRQLECPLTDDEKLTLFCEAESLRDRIDAVSAEREAVSKELAASIKHLEKDAREKGIAARAGVQIIEVEVEEITDIKKKIVQHRRTDTGEIIEERAMTQAELQIPLPGIEAPKPVENETDDETPAAYYERLRGDDDEYDDRLGQADDENDENEAA